MNNISIINDFKNYLIDLGLYANDNNAVNSFSIFQYSEEFKNYLDIKYETSESIFTKSLNDILDMEVVNGKLISQDEETTEENKNLLFADETENLDDVLPDESLNGVESEVLTTDAGNQEPSNNIDENNYFIEVLNNILEDETVIESLDKNKDGKLDNDEINAFFENIKNIDGNENDISFEDIFSGLEKIKEAKEKTEEKINAKNKAHGSSGSGGSSYVGSQNSGNNQQQEPTLENMTKEELQNELNIANATMQEKQAALEAIYNGTDSRLLELQQNIDTSYQAYQEQLSLLNKDMAAQLDEMIENISSKETEIAEQQTQIAQQEIALANCIANVTNTQNTLNSLNSNLSSLESTDTSTMDADAKADLENKISKLKQEIESTETALEQAQEEQQTAQDTLDSLNETKTLLDSELKELNETKAEFEEEIAEKYPEVEELQSAYEDAKNNYDTTKETLISDAENEVALAQIEIDKINTALTERINQEKTKEYSVSGLSMYDEEKGKALAQSILAYVDGNTTATGMCAKGVRIAMENVFGHSFTPSKGKDFAEANLVGNSDFVEITDEVTVDDLNSLPDGAIICWSEYESGHTASNGKAGHACMVAHDANGNTIEVSDYIRKNGVNTNFYKWGGSYRVFIPC